MSNSEDTNANLEHWLSQLQRGDTSSFEEAREALIAQAMGRLENLTRKMLRNSPRLQRWEQTGDVLQNSLLRLHRSLASVQPATAKEFYGLAATQIRRELIDLARHHFGAEGEAGHHLTAGAGRAADDPEGPLHQPEPSSSAQPQTLAEWAEFHEKVEQLPEPERDVFNLLWYEGLTQKEAADVVGVSERTIKTRWRSAKLKLRDLLNETPFS